MDFKTERQFTTRQQKLIYEEVYFNNDMTINNYNPLTGYELKYPQFFTANPSQEIKVLHQEEYKLLHQHINFVCAFHIEMIKDKNILIIISFW